jgi:hypothetical protein
MKSYSEDRYLKFEYNPVWANERLDRSQIGTGIDTVVPTLGTINAIIIPVAIFTPSNSNSIYVDANTGNDSTGDGTSANPYLTLTKSANSCTATITHVVCNGIFFEDLAGIDNQYFDGFYVVTLYDALLCPRPYNIMPDNATCIFAAALTGSDVTGDGTLTLPYASIGEAKTHVDGTHQIVYLLDNGPFIEDAFEFTGNFKNLDCLPYLRPVIKFNDDGLVTETITPHEFSANNSSYIATGVFSNDNFVVVYYDATSTDLKFIIYNSAGTIVKAETVITADISSFASVGVMSDDNFVVAFYDSTTTAGRFIIYNSAGTVVKALTNFTTNVINDLDLNVMNNDNFIIAYRDHTDADKGKFVIYDSAGTVVKTITEFTSNVPTYINIGVLSNDNFIIAYSDQTASNKGRFIFSHQIIQYAMAVSTAATLTGIRFDGDNLYYLAKMFSGTAKLTAKYCDIYGVTNPADTADAWPIYSTSEVDAQNNKIYDNGCGIYSDESTSTIKNNLLYWNTKGYALHIKGAGAGINIQHNTVVFNYGGIKLESNNGAEVVKNNICYGNDVYDYYADTLLTITYGISTGNRNLITMGTGMYEINPMFMDEGDLDPDDVDWHLQDISAGDSVSSIALNLGDDTAPDRDAGAYNTFLIGLGQTWSTFTTLKPVKVVLIDDPVGAARNVGDDGTISTSVKAWT